jgi:sporulation protein YlmC with PRC-barrel domain
MKKLVPQMFIAAAVALILAAGAAAQSSSQSPGGVMIDSKSLVGSTVRSSDGKDIGKVERLMIDPKDGRVRTVVISMGGTLGVGGNTVAMAWDQVKVAQDQGKLVVMVDQQALDRAPKAQGKDSTPSASPSTSGSDSKPK